MQIELLWPLVGILVLTQVALAILGWRYLTLAERLTKREAERSEMFVLDCMMETSNLRGDYDRLFEKQFDRMLAMVNTESLKAYTDARTAKTKIDHVHEERMKRVEVAGEKPVPYVRPGQAQEPTEQIGAGASMTSEL